MPAERRLTAPSAEAMEALGARLAAVCAPGTCIHLNGPLAAGKTTLARGYLRALGHAGAVKSPTFTLVESYELGARSVHHFDLYRLADAVELEFIGIEDYLAGGADCLIEWAERGAGVLGTADVTLDLAVVEDGREVIVRAHTERGRAAVCRLFK